MGKPVLATSASCVAAIPDIPILPIILSLETIGLLPSIAYAPCIDMTLNPTTPLARIFKSFGSTLEIIYSVYHAMSNFNEANLCVVHSLLKYKIAAGVNKCDHHYHLVFHIKCLGQFITIIEFY